MARKEARLKRRNEMSSSTRGALQTRINQLEMLLKDKLNEPAPDSLTPNEKDDFGEEVELLTSALINSLNNFESGITREYIVQKVVDFRVHYQRSSGKMIFNPVYKVIWEGYQEPTWEPIENMQTCKYVDDFWLSKKNETGWKVVWVEVGDSSE